MKIDINDPRITAFALGELTGSDAIEIARAVLMDARVRMAVDDAREASAQLMGILGDGDAHLLTPGQREAVRSAGARPVITDLASARVPFWKRPAVAGIGVAAAIAVAIFIVGGRPGGGSGDGGVESPAKWDWTQVDMQNLTAPVVSDAGVEGANGSSHAATTPMREAMRDDTTGFREEVKARIRLMPEGEIASGDSLPALDDASRQRWQGVRSGQRLVVPMTSGVTSWPWLERSILDQKKLPPRRAIRIEEMVNHFRYKKPTMISGAGWVADMEICKVPWSTNTALLAVHVQADGGLASESAILELNSERVRRVRLLGYARLKESGPVVVSGGPDRASRSHGNYVIYELEVVEGTEGSGRIAALTLGQGAASKPLSVGTVVDWAEASSDLRFASVVSACGIVLSGGSTSGELDADKLVSLVDMIERQDATGLGVKRKEGLKVIRRAAGLLSD
ncbi:MAG: von Willebrand factor type A domain-containing protein [Verrucomicrobiae bacterium]|nr:von Willebrand factor type A domain-containing protein [Verrucomicrobiae bacterium]NNJ42277.1 hypothetical protein [Akkermansiaceae bacterium]